MNEKGQGLVEFILLLGLAALVILAVLWLMDEMLPTLVATKVGCNSAQWQKCLELMTSGK